MELKVLRSHDYGNVLNSDRNSNYYHKFYFSFFELNNGSLISVMKIENFKTHKLIHTELQYNYVNDYKMGEDFSIYWERSFNKDLNKIKHPDKAEKILIKSYLNSSLNNLLI